MGCSVEGINSYRSLHQDKTWKFPAILFKPYLHFRSQQVFKYGRTKTFVFYYCISNSPVEFRDIDPHHPAKIKGVNSLDFRRGYHQVIHNSIIQNGFALTIEDRKSTRLNSSHSQISYAVFCLKKKTKQF